MNSSISGPVCGKDSAFGKGHSKKPRKKRHKNKLKNSGLRKKRFKKFYPANKQSFIKFNKTSDKVMSDWYWSNYKKAMEWQDRHQIAHWKATALALMEENRYLIQIINNLQPGLVPDLPVTHSKVDGTENFNKSQFISSVHMPGSSTWKSDDEDDQEDEQSDEQWNEEENNDEEFEFEMSEEMMQFFEQSYKHKMDLKKLKEKELLNKTEQEIEQKKLNKIKRSSEMNLLYGDGASMIIGMETAVQLSFDKYCDSKSPKYWPNIPFRL